MERGVWRVKYGERSMEREVWREEYGERRDETRNER
jgi:hypothetical protein